MATIHTGAEELASARRDEILGRKVAAGGSFVEATVGAGAVIMAVLGLASLMPVTMACIATIAIGAALVLEGGSVATRLFVAIDRGGAEVPGELMGGLGAESLAGLTAVALGFIALLHAEPFTLMDAGLVVIGAALLLGTAATWRVNYYPRYAEAPQNDTETYVMRQAVHAASGAHALVGASAVLLGILALLGYSTVTLTLVALLVVGGAMVISGAALGGRFLAALRR
jgi:hypothetical protein